MQLLEAVSKPVKDKKGIGNIKSWFTKDRLYNPVAFYEDVTGLQIGRAHCMFFNFFSRTFNVVCCSILTAKKVWYQLGK